MRYAPVVQPGPHDMEYERRTARHPGWKWWVALVKACLGLAIMATLVTASCVGIVAVFVEGQWCALGMAAVSLACFSFPAYLAVATALPILRGTEEHRR